MIQHGPPATRTRRHTRIYTHTHTHTNTQGQILHPRAPNGQHVSVSQPHLYRENAAFKDRLSDQTLSNNFKGACMTGDYELPTK